MKLGEIQKIYAELNGINSKKLPLKVGFIINRNLKKMQSVIEDLDKARNEAIEKYAERDDKGNIVQSENGGIRITDATAFSNDMAEVLETDIEIEFDKFTMEDLEKCESDGYDKLTVGEQGALEVMIS